MEGDDHRGGDSIGQFCDQLAILAAENAELVLDPYDISAACVDRLRRLRVAAWGIGRDAGNAIGIGKPASRRVERINIEADLGEMRGELLAQIGRDSGTSAAARRLCSDDGHAQSGA